MSSVQQSVEPLSPNPTGEISVEFGKSVVRLNWREWILVAIALATVLFVVPRFFPSTSQSSEDRIPFNASEDYWTYRERMTSYLAADRIPLIGDSVIWGEYVTADKTLSAYLNVESTFSKFANAGLDGAHPLALTGLVNHYTNALDHRRVILHCNLLWMSSAERDLQTNMDVSINHTRLIPQIFPSIPCYTAPLSQRLGIVIDRSIPFFDLLSHLRTTCFEGKDLQGWTIINPYSNFLTRLSRVSAAEADQLRHESVSWIEQGIRPQEILWIDLKTSLQWQAWKSVALNLIARSNQIFVIVGPFNEHLLTESSRQRYNERKQFVEAWLQQQDIPYLLPDALPTEEYGDASHPLSSGYARLAGTIHKNKGFRNWLDKGIDH